MRGAMRPSEAKAIREEAGLSAQEWADLLGVHFTTVYRWESGETTIRPMVASHLRRALADRVSAQPVSA